MAKANGKKNGKARGHNHADLAAHKFKAGDIGNPLNNGTTAPLNQLMADLTRHGQEMIQVHVEGQPVTYRTRSEVLSELIWRRAMEPLDKEYLPMQIACVKLIAERLAPIQREALPAPIIINVQTKNEIAFAEAVQSKANGRKIEPGDIIETLGESELEDDEI